MADMKVETRPTRLCDAYYLMHNLQQRDKDEITAFGLTPWAAVMRSYKLSTYMETVFINGEVAAIFGIAPIGTVMTNTAAPWMLTTHNVRKIRPLTFARIHKQMAMKFLDMYENLVNFVLGDYTEAIRLLQFSGFNVGELERYGTHSVAPYRKFSLRRT